MKAKSWLSMFGFFALAACGQAAQSGEPAPEAAALEPQENAPMLNGSMAERGAAADLAETVAVPQGRRVSNAEAEANGPPTWLRNRQPPPKGVAVDNQETGTAVGR